MRKLFYSLALCIMMLGLIPGGISAQRQLSDLPSVYIETEKRASIQSKENYIYSTLTYVDGDSIAVYDSVSIRGRGNSTWNLRKKPYRIKFLKKEKFLGKGYANAKSWTLLANHADKTLIRNALAAEVGNFMELPFNAAARFVDLTLNGKFVGNYQISDQVEVRKKRVDVTEQDFPLADTSNITGGYLIEVDGFGTSEPVHFRTGKNLIITVKYPDDDEIEESQKAYIKDYIQKFEDALFSADFKDPVKGYRAYVDSATLINWYLATEMTGNVDGFWSTYIYKEQDDPKLYFGPLWDYDIAFNNCNRVGEVTNSLMMDKGFGSDLTKIWMRRMWGDEWFAKAVNDRWKKLVANGMKDHLLAYIDHLASELNSSQALNYQQWKIDERAYNEIMLYSTYQGGIDYLKNFIDKHADYLTETFASLVDEEEPPIEEPSDPFEPDGEFYYRVGNKGSGKVLDVAGNSKEPGAVIEMWSPNFDSMGQYWEAKPVGQYIQFISRLSGLALQDNAVKVDGSYKTGYQLTQETPDEEDPRQLWKVEPVNTGDVYVLINRNSNLVMNNSGGNTADGNRVITYTNDDRNLTSNNRQWYVEKTEVKDNPSGVDENSMPSADYFVYYNPETQVIHFVAEDQSLIDTDVSLYSVSGTRIAEFRSTGDLSVADLPAGVYILRWMEGSQSRSVKFVKR